MIKNVYFVQGGRYILLSVPCVVREWYCLYWNRSGACKHVRMMLRNWDLTTCHVVVSLTRGFAPQCPVDWCYRAVCTAVRAVY